VVGHSRDYMGLVFEAYSQRDHLMVSGLNIWYRKVQNRAGMIEFRFLRSIEHEAYSAAIEESQLTRREQEVQTESVPVECSGAVEVVHVDGNLPNARDAESGSRGINGRLPPLLY
jgi:hypothetical protein